MYSKIIQNSQGVTLPAPVPQAQMSKAKSLPLPEQRFFALTGLRMTTLRSRGAQ